MGTIASVPKSASETGRPMNMLFVAVKALEKTPECTPSTWQTRAMMRLSRKQVQIEMKGVAIEPTSVRRPSWSSVCMTLEKR